MKWLFYIFILMTLSLYFAGNLKEQQLKSLYLISSARNNSLATKAAEMVLQVHDWHHRIFRFLPGISFEKKKSKALKVVAESGVDIKRSLKSSWEDLTPVIKKRVNEIAYDIAKGTSNKIP